MDAKQKLADAKANYETARAKIAEAMKEAIAEVAKETFEAVPGLLAIRWTQYTPYFNDGDACEFSVHDAEFLLEDGDPEGGDNEDGYFDLWSLNYEWEQKHGEGQKHPATPALEAFCKVHGSDEDFYRSAYGDHREVILRRDGSTEVEECSHD